MHYVESRAQNVDALFFKLGWDRTGFNKEHTTTHYAELVFLHLVGSVCHVLHSGVSKPRNINALFFLLEWD
jgi:hypothetical protein